jgi:DNA-binding response OmpR family regulator
MTSAHLLLLDDDLDMGVIVGILARKAGHRLTCCPDVASAWEALRRSPPELVLLDVNLPGESGLSLLARLRSDEALAGVRVALFCQSGLGADVAAGWALGADYFLPKDLVAEPAAWAERVGELLAHAGGQSTVTSVKWGVVGRGRSPWEEALKRAGEEPCLQALGAEVQVQLVRRARAQVLGNQAALVSPDAATPEQVERVFSSYLEQVWCLLGPRAVRGCAERLRSATAPGG